MMRCRIGLRIERIMTSRGILFTAPSVRALLAGTKTQSRRVVNPQPEIRKVLVGGPDFHQDGVPVGAEYRTEMLWNGHIRISESFLCLALGLHQQIPSRLGEQSLRVGD